MRWLLHFLGLDSAAGTPYLFWSGTGSDLGYLAVVAVIWHHLNCAEAGCWRIARHRTRHCRKHAQEAPGG